MKRLQNKIAESRFALPITIVYGLAIWMAIGAIEEQLYLQVLFFAVSVYLMVELNNRNALIRTYSRMVSCSFIMLTCMSAFMLRSASILAVQMCFIATYSILLRCYQDNKTQGMMFYAFFFVGLASTQFIQILFFVPILWIIIATKLVAFSFRGLLASILGIIVPYWFLAGYYWLTGDIRALLDKILGIAEFEPLFQYEGIDLQLIVTFAFIVILSFVGIIHFLNNSYKDKIRTRINYEIFIIMILVTLAFIVLQPQFVDYLLSLMIIPTSVLIAHYITLTNTKITNISFIVIALLTLAITIVNLWQTICSLWIPLSLFLENMAI